jgi:hypothetical protein
MNWPKFKREVEAAGLQPHDCGNGHWQIKGGGQLVNCWVNTRRGFVVAVGNGRGDRCELSRAIELAGPPKAPEPQTEKTYPASVPDKFPTSVSDNVPFGPDKPRVGLIRWLWRWIW